MHCPSIQGVLISSLDTVYSSRDISPLQPIMKCILIKLWLELLNSHLESSNENICCYLGMSLAFCVCLFCLMGHVCLWQGEHTHLVQLSALCVHALKEKGGEIKAAWHLNCSVTHTYTFTDNKDHCEEVTAGCVPGLNSHPLQGSCW